MILDLKDELVIDAVLWVFINHPQHQFTMIAEVDEVLGYRVPTTFWSNFILGPGFITAKPDHKFYKITEKGRRRIGL